MAKATRLTEAFTEWLNMKRQSDVSTQRKDQLRDAMMVVLERSGEEDEKGSLYIDLPEPVEYIEPGKPGKDGRPGAAKIHQYTSLKRQKALRPAEPTPDPDLALELLKEKGLWLTAKQQKALQELQLSCPYARVEIEVSPDAVAELYYKELITEEEYDSILVEQKVVWSFIPCED